MKTWGLIIEFKFPLILICLRVNDIPFYKAESELTDLKLEFVNFVKKIRAFLRFFNSVFNEKSRRDSMKIVAYQKKQFFI